MFGTSVNIKEIKNKLIMFDISEKEMTAASEWMDDHSKAHVMKSVGAIGGRWKWSFTPTSIGDVKKISCTCGAECDITDYNMW